MAEPDMAALVEHMKREQREIIVAAAKAGALPSDGALRKIAALEIAIGAAEHELEEQGNGS